MQPTKETLEQTYLREFLQDQTSLRISEIEMVMPPRPDAWATVREKGRLRTLDIELTKYHVDESSNVQGGSPGVRRDRIWKKVQQHLVGPLQTNPLKFDVWVTLKDKDFLPDRDVEAFAKELEQLVRNSSFPGDILVMYCDARYTSMSSKTGQESANIPAKYTNLHNHLKKLRICKVSYEPLFWTCTNCSAANINVSPHLLAEIIETKSVKKYEWRESAEKWLLIYASGDAVVARGAPFPDFVDWQNEDLQKSCISSQFQRIFFWERVAGWTKSIK
jgi:hypothetical protein